METVDKSTANTEILIELEKKLNKEDSMDFIEALWDLGIVDNAENLPISESSEDTLARMRTKVEEEDKAAPKSSAECLERIKVICKEAIANYDNESFFEDDVDKFMGESIMAENVMDIIDSYEKYRERHENIRIDI